MYLYSTHFVVPHTQGAQAWITQCYLQLHQCQRSSDGASARGCGHLIAAYYLFIHPRKDERLSQRDLLTNSGRFTHISGHPSAAGQVQDRESSPVKDRRSTTAPRNQPTVDLQLVSSAAMRDFMLRKSQHRI